MVSGASTNTAELVPFPVPSSANKATAAVGYVAGFDGLRAFAICAVVAFHARLLSFPGILYGVDIFNALSGFLITGILLKEFEKRGTISIRSFYLRRALRLYPALIAMLVVYLAYSYAFRKYPDRTLPQALIGLLGMVNWSRALSWYGLRDLGHLWSLSIELQFCVLWAPFCFLILRRWKTPEALAIACLGLFLIIQLHRYGLVSRWTMGRVSGRRLYDGTDLRLDVFALAAAARAVLAGRTAFASRVQEWIGRYGGVVLLSGVFLHVYLGWAFTFRQYILSVVITNAVALSCVMLVVGVNSAPQSFVVRILGWAPIRTFGLISYGMYLWHYPLIQLFPWRVGVETRALGVFMLSIVCGTLSYQLIEKPLMRKKRETPPARQPSAPSELICSTASRAQEGASDIRPASNA
ncbi:MAG: acyltransferase [Deltaproteobacteria bacterium]|nr:acyltransferase [Deltaproteobacteria bacterium]